MQLTPEEDDGSFSVVFLPPGGTGTKTEVGGGFSFFYFHPEPWGNDPI